MHAILGHSENCIAVMPSDMCVALAALEAVVRVVGPEQDNTLGENELILSIDLPPRGFAEHHTYLKLRDRLSYAFALVSVAIGYELDGEGKITHARIALGGVAHKPWRVPKAEDLLVGQEPNDASFARAAEALLAGSQGFEHNTFKTDLAHRAILRAGAMALDPSCQRPGAKPSL